MNMAQIDYVASIGSIYLDLLYVPSIKDISAGTQETEGAEY